MKMPPTKHFLNSWLLLSMITIGGIAQTIETSTFQNPCALKASCHECIQTPSCAWCLDPNYANYTRCFLQSIIGVNGCSQEFILSPDNLLSIIRNDNLTREHVAGVGTEDGTNPGTGERGSRTPHQKIQLAPQRLNLKLRAGESYSIRMYFSNTDSPIDLYYLMDLSKSMEDDKDKLYHLGNQLAFTMKQLTSDFRLGFGSFVDKVVMPYVNTLPANLREPCVGCAAPYGFKHAMRLSENSSQFSQVVRQAKVSGNLDSPEGGFDAVIQAAECRDQIGWRSNAKRLLVFSTDSTSHVAGDGKLGGIVKPNDGLCHLSEEGIYTQSSFQDYPSIEHINVILKKSRIHMIFAVTSGVSGYYKDLAENIEGATVGRLEGDSSNIVELVKEQYEQISSRVEMKHNASRDVNLKFFTRCSNTTGDLVNTNICDTVKAGEVIEFRIEIEVLKCPKSRDDYFQTIEIYPVGIGESLIIDLEMLCECSCERSLSQFYEENSQRCNHHGTYKCGVCECTNEAYGRNCECISNETRASETNCMNPMIPNGLECTGRGQCVCGHCECLVRSNEKEKIYGKYCECDNFSCERHNGKLCSDHGTCDCGVCKCEAPWTGASCSCSTNTTSCYPPGGQDNGLCSGHGECQCGQCVCEVVDEKSYTGKFCERCPTCPVPEQSD